MEKPPMNRHSLSETYFQAHASSYDMLGTESWRAGVPIALDLGTFDPDFDRFVGGREFSNLLASHSILAMSGRGHIQDVLGVMEELSDALGAAGP